MFKIFSTYICWINIYNATLEVSGAVRTLYGALGVKRLKERWKRGEDEVEDVSSYYITVRRWYDDGNGKGKALECTVWRTPSGRGRTCRKTDFNMMVIIIINYYYYCYYVLVQTDVSLHLFTTLTVHSRLWCTVFVQQTPLFGYVTALSDILFSPTSSHTDARYTDVVP